MKEVGLYLILELSTDINPTGSELRFHVEEGLQESKLGNRLLQPSQFSLLAARRRWVQAVQNEPPGEPLGVTTFWGT